MWSSRPVAMEPVGLKVAVLGSYNSAEPLTMPEASPPPATRTRPSDTSVAVWPQLAVAIAPVGLKVPVLGS